MQMTFNYQLTSFQTGKKFNREVLYSNSPRNFFLYAGTKGLVCIMPIAISFFNFVKF